MISKDKVSFNKSFFAIIFMILVVQIISIGIVINEINKLKININDVSDNLNLAESQLSNKIEMNDKDLQSKINELSNSLLSIKTDLDQEISSIKAETSADFSGIISNAVNSVVSIRTDVAQGTGFIISKDGFVVTNAHVLSGARTVSAITAEQETKEISLVGYDPQLDLALLKMKGNFEYLSLGDSDDIIVGEKVIAIGNPLGLSFSVSEGIVSAVDRAGENGIKGYIQTDAALNPGNSGGPLIDTDGKVIGINNFKITGENLGFALESNFIKSAVDEISMRELNISVIG